MEQTTRWATRLVGVAVALAAGTAAAGMLSVPGTWGASAHEVGTARAFSLFAAGPAGAFGNPAALAQEKGSRVQLGYLYTAPRLRLSGEAAPTRRNEVPVLGLQIDMSNLTTLGKQVTLGLVTSADDNFTGLLRFGGDPATSPYLRYGESQLALVPSAAIEVFDWLLLGAGAAITLNAGADLGVSTTLSGQTSNEVVAVRADTGLVPVLGAMLRLPPSRVLNMAIGGSLRGRATYLVDVRAEADAQLGGSTLTRLPLTLRFLDAFSPAEVNGGFQSGIVELGLVMGGSLTYQRWSELGQALVDNDSARRDLGLDFRDTLVVRGGVEFRPAAVLPLPPALEQLQLRAGGASEPSPLRSTSAGPLVDAHRWVAAAGVGYTLQNPHALLLQSPASFDFGYQLHVLTRRDFELTGADGARRQVTTGGVVHAFSGTLTLRY